MDLKNLPYRSAEKLIAFLCQERYAEEILGDLEEYRHKLKVGKSQFKPIKYWYQSLNFLRPYALKTPFKNSNTRIMLKMNLTIAIRNLLRHKFYSGINILGLALGIATCLFIGTFISHELSYDEHWVNSEHIYRVAGHLKFEGNEWRMATSPAPMAGAFKEDFSEIIASGRMRNVGSEILEVNKKLVKAEEVAFTDQEIFKIFSFKKIAGRLDLSQPNTVAISQSAARLLYGSEDAVGKTFKIDETVFQVEGIYEDIPQNTHFHYDVLISMKNYPDSDNKVWFSNNYRTYFLLDETANPAVLERKFETVYERYFGPMLNSHAGTTWDQFMEAGSIVHYFLQPLESIHLHSDLSYEIEQNGSFQYIVIFGAAGLFVLIIACINFMNISTARSSSRAKEVGMRKVLGSERRYIVNQFMLESLLNAFIAGLIACLALYLLLPLFNGITDKSIQDPLFGDLFLFPWFLGGVIVVGLLAGIYPALYLSKFIPIKVLKGDLRLGIKTSWMRNTLVIIQFGASVVLIFGSVVVGAQMGYIQSKSLGFEKEQVLILQNTYMMGDKIDAFREEVVNHPAIINATMTSYLPTSESRSDSPLLPKEAVNNENFVSLQLWRVDENYIPTMGMNLNQGRNFQKDLASDSNSVILNQAALNKFGFENPIGRELKTLHGFEIAGIGNFKIIGVVDDFHYDSFKSTINPMVLLNIRSTGSIALKFKPGALADVIDHIDGLWSSFNPNQALEYSFMDQQFEAKYRSEQKLGMLFTIFSSLAIFIACLGLFGLAAFTTDQRKKELGIRKVMGASITNLMLHQMTGYTKLLVIAVLLSLPIGIYVMREWLQNFAFRTDISLFMILSPILLVLLLAWFTVSIISYKAARQNPVDNLKYE